MATTRHRRPGRRTIAFAAVLTVLGVAAHGTPDASAAIRSGGGEVGKVPPTATASFLGSGTGPIPDGSGGMGADCSSRVVPGTRDVTFQVSGVTGPLTDVSVSTSLVHGYAGDLTARLIAPGGASVTLFDRPGVASIDSCGESSDFVGAYVFTDRAPAPPAEQWAARGENEALPPGAYRATAFGSPAPAAMTAPFAGLANPNGTWTLRLTDSGQPDPGTISAASLALQWTDLAPCRAATDEVASATKKLKKAKKKLRNARSALREAVGGSPAAVSAAAQKVRQAERATKRAKKKLKKAEAAQAAVC